MEQKECSSEMEALKLKISKAQKESPIYEKLGSYIENNFMRIIFMTANEVAVENGVSQGSVSRFCIALGYRGYNDFLRILQKYISEEITAPQRLQYISQDKNEEKILNILNMEHKNINELQNIVNQPAYSKLVSEIVEARSVILLSARMSATLLPYTGYIMNKIRDGVTEIVPNISQWDTLSQHNPEGVLVLSLVFPRYPNILILKMEELHKAGFKIAVLTDNAISPIVDSSDLILQIPITISSIFDVYSTPIIFLNLLMRDVAKGIKSLDKRLNALEQIDMDNNIYYKNEM